MSVAEEVAKLEQRRLAGEISQAEFEAQVARVAAGLRASSPTLVPLHPDLDADTEITTDGLPIEAPREEVPDPFGGVPPRFPAATPLEVEARAGDRPRGAALDARGRSADPPPGPFSESDPVPSRIGAYKLVEIVGQGGMGLVYAAKHLERPGLFAVKLPRPHLAADADFVHRFRREARVGLKLDHPGIVKVHDLIIDGGYPAIVMDFVSGADLDTLLRNTGGPLAWGRTADIFGQILDAVAYAHSMGCIHRDLKPKNVLVRLDGRTLVTDFGLARVRRGGATQTDVLLGTATYLAPEVYAAGAKASVRSDIYALGMTLYKMLLGRLPFEPGTPADRIMQLKGAGAIQPPSALQPALSKDVDALVMTALAPVPAARFENCEAFAAEFRRVMSGLQTQPTMPLAGPSGVLQPQATLPFVGSEATSPPLPPRHPDDDLLAATLDGMPSVFSAASEATLDGGESGASPVRARRGRYVAPTVDAPAVGRQKIDSPGPAVTRSGRRLIALLGVLLLAAVGANIYLLLNEDARGVGSGFLRGGDAFGDALRQADRRAAAEAGLSEGLPPGATPRPRRADDLEVDWGGEKAPGSAMPETVAEEPVSSAGDELSAAVQELSAVAAREAVTRGHGTLHLTSSPPSKVEIDGVPYGTTEVTRRGIPLPEGEHVVRFRCDGPACSGLKRRGAKKTVIIEPGRTLRFHADFVELNRRAVRSGPASPSSAPVDPTPAQPEPDQ